MNIYRMDKTMMIIGGAFAAFAVLMVAVIIILIANWMDFSKTCESTEAVIKSIYTSHSGDSTKHHVQVEYVVDGEIYRNYLNYYTSSMRRGQTVTVYYDPEDPYYTMDKPYAACVIIGIFILIFGGVGFGFIISELRNKRIINRLAEENKYIVLDSTTERMEVRANVKVNNVHYVKMNFIYRDQFGGEYIFSSRAYAPGKCPFDPWQSVTVYVDIEKNPKKYYVCADNDYFTEDKKNFLDDGIRY